MASVSALMRISDIPDDTPHREEIIKNAVNPLTDGGSCVAGPDGEWVLDPVVDQEDLFMVELDFNRVLEERQNLDISGHYSRPDVTKLTINRERQSVALIVD